MQYTDRINKLCELYDDLQSWPPVNISGYMAYRDGDYFSFEKEGGICIDRHRTNKIQFTLQDPDEIHTHIESLLKHFEESYNSFVQK